MIKPRTLLVGLFITLVCGLSVLRLATPARVSAAGPPPETCADGTEPLRGDKNNCGKCDDNGFLGLISWHHYLTKRDDCSISLKLTTPGPDTNGDGIPDSTTTNTGNLNALWLIAIAVFEDLLRIAGVVAVGFIVFGGIGFITGDGQPENMKKAQATIINALIGLGIAIIGATLIAFIGNKLGGA